MDRLKRYVASKPVLKLILKPIAKAGVAVMRPVLKLILEPIAKAGVAILIRIVRLTDGKPWAPIFYFFLPEQNTNIIPYLHVLHNVQVKTGRRVIVISAWRFWPKSTAKDRSFLSFIQGLTPGIRYVWIPEWLEHLIHYVVIWALRCAGRYEAWWKPRDLQATIRYHHFSTAENTDILNYGARVVFHIPKSHEHVLEKRLNELGVSPDDWFVCVHAREHGWHRDVAKTEYPAGYRFEQEDHRNVDIQDYFPAIDYIISKGGKVVRIGDPSMRRINGVEGFVDYPFTKHWGLPMDLFLLSRCRFFLGCCSGPWMLPAAFNKPALITNFPPPVMTVKAPYSNALFLMKHVVEIESGRVLSMREMFEGIKCIINDPIRFESMGLAWRSNKPEDILEATKEMLYLIENDAFDRRRTREQELFHQLRLEAEDYLCSTAQGHIKFRYSNGRSSQSRISATFAVRYFGDEESLPAGMLNASEAALGGRAAV